MAEASMKVIASVRVTADSVIARGPVLYWGYDGNLAGPFSFALRDGVNASAPVKIEVGDASTVGRSGYMPHPVLFYNGLFADLGAGVTSLTVFIEPLREEQMVGRAEEYVEGAPE